MKKEHLKKYLNSFANTSVGVIGDLMLDRYIWGKVNRISPEAPVPIVDVQKITSVLGGAGNVMRNVITLGGQCIPFGVIDTKDNGVQIKMELEKYNIDIDTLSVDDVYPSICKERILASNQQLLRVDYEKVVPVSINCQYKIITKLKEVIQAQKIKVLIFEDYAKGLLSQSFVQNLVNYANAADIITILDPNRRNKIYIQGLTVLKPNRIEAFALADVPYIEPEEDKDHEKLKEVAKILLTKFQVKYLLISLADEGMAIFTSTDFTIIPTVAKEVYDVSGAGDTVVATLGLALANKLDIMTATTLANYAAGIVVGKIGTATVTPEEIIRTYAD